MEGIGLYLCKKLVSLMGGTLTLDESYDSGIPGCPGTRITFCLKASISVPTQPDDIQNYQGGDAQSSLLAEELEIPPALPEGLSVLFVDDDAILRKLFARVTQRVAPTWEIRQASNGETALQLTDTETFDLIFMDMYMASVEKQLLGTEAVAALRTKGVTSCICGLSANDKESEFLEAGANAFLFKPFPCTDKLLTRELLRILNSIDTDTC
jgi:two-component system, NarL family, sensor histidine kinase EvgS